MHSGESLRDIEARLSAQSDKLHHMGSRASYPQKTRQRTAFCDDAHYSGGSASFCYMFLEKIGKECQ